MREILFRGKRTDNGEWVEGYLTRRPSAIQYEANNSPWYIDVPPRDPDDSGNSYNVDGGTVGQFTGLKDKNGTRIFEGDILHIVSEVCEYDYKTSVAQKYVYKCFIVDGMFGDGDFTEISFACDWWSNEEATREVIGNIYDTPELLSKERANNE